MQSNKTKNTSKNKKRLFLLLGVAVVVLVSAGAVWAYTATRSEDFSGTAGVSKVNYGPPTEEEQQAANTQKDKNVEQEKIENDPTPSTTADVVVTDASYYSDSNTVEIRGYVGNVFEDGGTCTATITKSGKTVTRTSTAFKAATNTQCGAIDIPRSEFTETGTWDVTLTYSTPTTTGTGKATLKL